MNLSDTFYVALCMTVLILGAVYWFWTQNQFILRKLNLLENIVYEMKTALPSSWNQGAIPGSGSGHDGFGTFGVPAADKIPVVEPTATIYAPAPGSVISDEDADILHEELSQDNLHQTSDSPVLQVLSTSHESVKTSEPSVSEDLQPGGVGSGITRSDAHNSDEDVKASITNPYDSMPLKELRRLGEARGISGASKMAKQALINTLRSTPISNLSFDPPGGTLDLTEGVVNLA
jgi:hypothetical protein